MTKIKKKLTFFRHVELPKQTAPPRRSFAARSGAFRGDPQLNVGALPKPIYTRAYQRLAVVGPPNSLKLYTIYYILYTIY